MAPQVTEGAVSSGGKTYSRFCAKLLARCPGRPPTPRSGVAHEDVAHSRRTRPDAVFPSTVCSVPGSPASSSEVPSAQVDCPRPGGGGCGHSPKESVLLQTETVPPAPRAHAGPTASTAVTQPRDRTRGPHIPAPPGVVCPGPEVSQAWAPKGLSPAGAPAWQGQPFDLRLGWGARGRGASFTHAACPQPQPFLSS